MDIGSDDLDLEKISLPPRLELIAPIWDSIPETMLPLPEFHGQELERRLIAADATTNDGIPWEQVKVRFIERRLR
jgi:putative addiction module component (TIGR02574 family)